MVRCNHEAYAATHGYHYANPLLNTSSWQASRFVLNGIRYKTFAILSHLDRYDVVIWIDYDATFYNMVMLVTHWTDNMGAAEILMAADIPGYKFNTGLQIIKSSEWTKNFYSSAVDSLIDSDVNASYVDQPILYKLHDSIEGGKEKVKIYKPRGDFQAFLKIKSDLRPSSWVVHATQCACDPSKFINSKCRRTSIGAV